MVGTLAEMLYNPIAEVIRDMMKRIQPPWKLGSSYQKNLRKALCMKIALPREYMNMDMDSRVKGKVMETVNHLKILGGHRKRYLYPMLNIIGLILFNSCI